MCMRISDCTLHRDCYLWPYGYKGWLCLCICVHERVRMEFYCERRVEREIEWERREKGKKLFAKGVDSESSLSSLNDRWANTENVTINQNITYDMQVVQIRFSHIFFIKFHLVKWHSKSFVMSFVSMRKLPQNWDKVKAHVLSDEHCKSEHQPDGGSHRICSYSLTVLSIFGILCPIP